MIEKGKYKYTVGQWDVDYTNRITHVAFADYMLHAAGDDADKNGFGIADLNLDNCSWVLSRVSVEYLRRPLSGEEITVTTWVNDISKLMTTRNMIITDEAGGVIANSVTQWAVIDIEKRVALDIRQNVDYAGSLNEEPCPIEKPARVKRVENGDVFNHRVAYSDMDFNKHMNALKYLEWMIDVLPLESVQDGGLRRLDINFLHEALYGQELTLKFEDGEEQSLFEITNREELPLCRASITWAGSR